MTTTINDDGRRYRVVSQSGDRERSAWYADTLADIVEGVNLQNHGVPVWYVEEWNGTEWLTVPQADLIAVQEELYADA